jgi:hypothetical protein
MKFVVLSGGICGFVVAGATGLWAGHAGDRTLLDAALGCLAGGLLFRGFWAVLLGGIRQAYLARRAAAAASAPPKKIQP